MARASTRRVTQAPRAGHRCQTVFAEAADSRGLGSRHGYCTYTSSMNRPRRDNVLCAGLALAAAAATAGCEARSMSGNDGGMGAAGTSGGDGGQADQTAVCAFSRTYVWNNQMTVRGGTFVSSQGQLLRLTPPDGFVLESAASTTQGTTSSTCAAPLPPCGSPDLIDVADIEAALAAPDVQAVVSQMVPPFYGEQNVADPPESYSFRYGDAVGFAGVSCLSPTLCVPMPSGVATLVEMLRKLITQQLAQPSCATSAGISGN